MSFSKYSAVSLGSREVELSTLSYGVQVRASLGYCTEYILPPAGLQQVNEEVGSCRYSVYR